MSDQRLTARQRAQLSDFRRRWLHVYECTDPVEPAMAEKALSRMYELAGKSAPEFVWCDSPLAGSAVVYQLMLRSSIYDGLVAGVERRAKVSCRVHVSEAIRDRISTRYRLQTPRVVLDVAEPDSLDAAAESAFGDPPGAPLRDSVRPEPDSIDPEAESTFRSSVGETLREYVSRVVLRNLGDRLGQPFSFPHPASCFGPFGILDPRDSLDRANVSQEEAREYSFDEQMEESLSAWLRSWMRDELGEPPGFRATSSHLPRAFFGWDFIPWVAWLQNWKDSLGQDFPGREMTSVEHWSDIIHHCFWWWPFERVCVVSRRPVLVRLEPVRDSLEFHCDDGAAIAFTDGQKGFAWHGVRVPKEVVVTPPEKLDSRWVLRVRNVEVRRELVRRIGLEKVCRDLRSLVVDRDGDYELLVLHIRAGRPRPFLRMLNPSTGDWHVEGVHPRCDTVKKALEWRNRTSVRPSILT